MANRCKKISKELNVQCVRRAGHKMAHAYPNSYMKKVDPGYWRALMHPHVTLTLDEITLDEMQESTFDFEKVDGVTEA